MTANQIAYSKHLEEARHNRVSERHEHYDTRTRRMTAITGAKSLEETQRHNTETERLNWWTATESQRHNQEVERQNWWNMQTTAAENRRHNTVTEAQRSLEIENDSQYKRDTAWAQQMQASAAMRRAETAQYDAETSRMNAETNSRNATTRENELAASISAVRQNVGVQYANIAEQRRHSQAVESETAQHNRTSEMLGVDQMWRTTEETVRHNQAMEKTNQYNAETNRMNADSSRIQAAAASQNASTNSKRVSVEARNATSNRINALSNLARSIILTGGIT